MAYVSTSYECELCDLGDSVCKINAVVLVSKTAQYEDER